MAEHTNEPRYPDIELDYPPGGNIFDLIGRTRVLMRRAGVPNSEIEAMSREVHGTQSYKDACAAIGRWVSWYGAEA